MTSPVPARLARVTKRFGTVVALDGVDVDVRSGETLALLGPNGAGKTTAVRLLLGIGKPDSGEVTLFGRDPRVAAHRTRSGAMLQTSGIPATLTVREHVTLFRTYYPHPLPVDDVLATAGLSSLANRRYGTLSGGQKQRVGFALAICGDPDILFLDEPTVGLDLEARHALWAQIRAFVARGKSVLLTTHYLAEADALADRVAVLVKGRIVAEDTPERLKASAGARTIRCTTGLDDAALRALDGVIEVRRVDRLVHLATHDADAVVRVLYARDPTFSLVDVAETPLEDAFVALTSQEIPS